jgi:hypothetical protein
LRSEHEIKQVFNGASVVILFPRGINNHRQSLRLRDIPVQVPGLNYRRPKRWQWAARKSGNTTERAPGVLSERSLDFLAPGLQRA